MCMLIVKQVSASTGVKYWFVLAWGGKLDKTSTRIPKSILLQECKDLNKKPTTPKLSQYKFTIEQGKGLYKPYFPRQFTEKTKAETISYYFREGFVLIYN